MLEWEKNENKRKRRRDWPIFLKKNFLKQDSSIGEPDPSDPGEELLSSGQGSGHRPDRRSRGRRSQGLNLPVKIVHLEILLKSLAIHIK